MAGVANASREKIATGVYSAVTRNFFIATLLKTAKIVHICLISRIRTDSYGKNIIDIVVPEKIQTDSRDFWFKK
jgi:hypothetical protein